MPFVYATALPAHSSPVEAGRLRALCAGWEGRAFPGLSPRQREHCRRFFPEGAGLRARASRLLGRLLALRALPVGAMLDRDDSGRPRVDGAPGWRVAFSHSGSAAFCLVCAPGECPDDACGAPALDAEAWGGPRPADRAFAAPAPTRAASLCRWVLAEALFKALGAAPPLWGAVAEAAHAGCGRRAGTWTTRAGRLSWRFLAAPGHVLCAALPNAPATPLRLRWLSWRDLA